MSKLFVLTSAVQFTHSSLSYPLPLAMAGIRQNYHEDSEKGVNDQINMEFYSMYTFLSMVSLEEFYSMYTFLSMVSLEEFYSMYTFLSMVSLEEFYSMYTFLSMVSLEELYMCSYKGKHHFREMHCQTMFWGNISDLGEMRW